MRAARLKFNHKFCPAAETDSCSKGTEAMESN